jgi:hypothetical protein
MLFLMLQCASKKDPDPLSWIIHKRIATLAGLEPTPPKGFDI